MPQELQVLFLPFLACLILTGIHVYLGIHVISRKVIFVDIALAQIAALGATVAFLLGYDPRSESTYLLSLAFAVMAAVIFALTRTRAERVPQEAVIGLTYATASAGAILLADLAPHGAEHLHDLLAGSIVWVTRDQILKTAILYGAIGLFHFVFRRRFLMISLNPEEAYARGIRVRMWDFLFYLSFGVVITSSVQIAGVLLVFCYLVAPAVFAVMFFDDLKRRLITGWAMASIVSAVGLYFSYDRPSGPTIILGFAATLAIGATLHAVAHAPSRRRALAITAVSLLVVAGAVLALVRSRPVVVATHHEDADEDGISAAADGSRPLAHALGDDLPDLRQALRDTHETVRVRAVRELAATADPRILPDLFGALRDQAAAVREAAASELQRLGNRSAVPHLRQALKNRDEDAWVRLRMAQALAGLGEREGLSELADLAEHGEAKMMRLQALLALKRLLALEGDDPQDPDEPAGRDLLARARRAIARGGF